MALVFAAVGLTGCGGEDDDGGGADMAMGEGGGVPAEFADLSNPFNGDADARTAGQAIYDMACAVCHGADGTGGPQFNPAASDFTIDQSVWTDGYLFWRVRSGPEGGPSGSIMPAYSGSQSEDQSWQVITYIRSLGAQ